MEQTRVPLMPLSSNTLPSQPVPNLIYAPSPVLHSGITQANQTKSGLVIQANQNILTKDRANTPQRNPSTPVPHPLPSTFNDSSFHPSVSQGDSFHQTPYGERGLPLTVYSTPDSLAALAVDTTMGSGDVTLGRTHYSLPSPNFSRHYPEEEAQLAELIARMEKGMPLDVSRDG